MSLFLFTKTSLFMLGYTTILNYFRTNVNNYFLPVSPVTDLKFISTAFLSMTAGLKHSGCSKAQHKKFKDGYDPKDRVPVPEQDRDNPGKAH